MRGSLYPGRAGELSKSNAGVQCCVPECAAGAEPFALSTLLLHCKPCMQAWAVLTTLLKLMHST